MTCKCRHCTADYLHQIARMVVDDDLKVADVCRDQNLGETAVRRWVDQVKAERGGGPGVGQPLAAENQRRRKTLGYHTPADILQITVAPTH